MAAHLRKHDVLTKISEEVRFARRRFGRYDAIDFLVVLFGYVISGERTLEADLARGCSPLPRHSWPYVSVIGCPPVRRSHAFWQR